MQASFRIRALPRERFEPLLSLDEDGLATFGARWVTVSENPGFPCRVGLRDLEVGDRALLLPFVHHDVDSPYRASGPVFVQPESGAPGLADDEIPPLLTRRTLSIRGYDSGGDLRAAMVCGGGDAAARFTLLFEQAEVAYLHVHSASAGCYLCRVDRAGNTGMKGAAGGFSSQARPR